MTFKLKILGSNSAAPAHNRNQTAQLLNVNNQLFLIDCGEGTQMQMARYKIKLNKIHHIFISHLHGDHFFGLLGLISTMHLFKRKKDLHIYAPPGLAEIITLQLKHSGSNLNFKIRMIELMKLEPELIFQNDFLTVTTIPLEHRVICNGFLFREKPKPYKVNKEKIPPGFSLSNMSRLKKGEDIKDAEGHLVYKNSDLTLPPKPSYAYAYCSDTKYNENIVPQIKGVDLLYHESTFLNDMADRARETYHSTAAQAAEIARMAGVKILVLGHYSVRYKDLQPLLDEAQPIFPHTVLAKEGKNIVIEN